MEVSKLNEISDKLDKIINKVEYKNIENKYKNIENNVIAEKNKELSLKNIELEQENKKLYELTIINKINKFNIDYISLPSNKKFNKIHSYYSHIYITYTVDFNGKYKNHRDMISFINNYKGEYESIDLLKSLILFICMKFKPKLDDYKDIDTYKKDMVEFNKIIVPYINIYIDNLYYFDENLQDLYNFYLLLLPYLTDNVKIHDNTYNKPNNLDLYYKN